MSNIEFRYMYRDGSNYKKFGSVVFSNAEQRKLLELETELKQALSDDDLFIASQIRVPEVFLFADGPFSFDDHCYHEAVGLRTTDDNPSDEHHRTVSEFLAEVARKDQRGWLDFDPYDSEGSYGQLLTSRFS